MTEAKLHFDEETMAALNRLKEVWSQAMPNAKLSDVIKRAATEAVENHDPLKKIDRFEARRAARSVKASEKSATKNADEAAPQDFTPAPEQSKAATRRSVWKRDQSQCTFVDASGERCRAKHFLEEDHILPKAMGGEYSESNIRLRCRTHNQRHAIDSYGATKMRAHLPLMHH